MRLGIEPPYLFYPGQFWAHKNHAAVLDALAEVRSRGETLSLVLVGSDKGQLDHVRAQIHARGLDDAVRILGYVDEDELVGLYQHAHALVYLSRFGPENLPPLEAFALGCPVVVADVPGAAEQVGDAGLVVDADDPSAVADAIQRVGAAEGADAAGEGGEGARGRLDGGRLPPRPGLLPRSVRAGAQALGVGRAGRYILPRCQRPHFAAPACAATSDGRRESSSTPSAGAGSASACSCGRSARTTPRGSGASGSGPTSRRTSSTTASVRSTSPSARRRAARIRGSVPSSPPR